MVRPDSRIVGDVVIPNEGLAPDLARDLRQMFGRIPIRNDLLTGPKEIDARIDDPPEVSQVSFRRGPKLAHQSRVVRIVGGADDEAFGAAPCTDVCEHCRLKAGESLDVAAHI